MDKQALSDITVPKKYAAYREAHIEGYPCPTCGAKRMYVSARNKEKSKHKDCKACANSKSGGGSGVSYDSEGRKLCGCCKARPQKHNSLCQECSSKKLMENYFQKYRFQKYGITKEEFYARFTGKCEICAKEINERSAHIDHDHSSLKVRGILCDLCNKGLGQFKDSIDFLKAAVAYMERSKCIN